MAATAAVVAAVFHYGERTAKKSVAAKQSEKETQQRKGEASQHAKSGQVAPYWTDAQRRFGDTAAPRPSSYTGWLDIVVSCSGVPFLSWTFVDSQKIYG